MTKTVTMRKMIAFCGGLWLYALPIFSQAVADTQYVYTIHLGTFQEVLPRDFAQVRALGFVYRQPVGRMVDVFLGGWDDQAAPQQLLPTIINMGYSASVRKLPVTQGQPVRVIQLGAERATGPIDWERYFVAEQLHVLLANDMVKVMAGPYTDEAALRADLAMFREKGFAQAFAKTVNSALLHAVTSFETGGIKQPAFDIDLPKRGTQPTQPEELVRPTTYDMPTSQGDVRTKAVEPTPHASGAAVPQIRSNVKRSSARRLQAVLKELGYLGSGIDGYYGRMTAAAFDEAWATHRQVQKYRLLSRTALFAEMPARDGSLQQAVDRLAADPDWAVPLLESSARPEGRAWLAYHLFVTQGPSSQVDQLMNRAIREAFLDVDPKRFPSFDPRARYTYAELEQLLRHLFYVLVAAPKDRLALPCWLIQRHRRLMEQVLAGPVARANEWGLSGCAEVGGWEPVQVLRAIMQDMAAGQASDVAARRAAASEWVKLLLLPHTVESEAVADAVTWTERLAQSVEGWALRDPLLAEIAQAWKLAWYQSFVLLEDWFMDRGLKPAEARKRAAAALWVLAQPWMKRFV